MGVGEIIIKHCILCYVEHWGGDLSLRNAEEHDNEPTQEQIKEALNRVELLDNFDYQINYGTGAVLPDHKMPKKSKVKSIYAVVEKRYIKT